MASIRDIFQSYGYPGANERTGNTLAGRYFPDAPRGMLGRASTRNDIPQNWWEGDMFNMPGLPAVDPLTNLPEEAVPGAGSRPSPASGETDPFGGEGGAESGHDRGVAPGVDLADLEATPENVAGVLGGLGQFGLGPMGALAGLAGVGPNWGDIASDYFGDDIEYDPGLGGLDEGIDPEGFSQDISQDIDAAGGDSTDTGPDPEGPSQDISADIDAAGGDDTGDDDDCVISTALNRSGAWTDSEKRAAVLWCRDTHHNGSLRGRVWVRGYHRWGRVVVRLAGRSTAFRRLVKVCSTAFVGHVTGKKRSILGFIIKWLWATPLSYVMGVR